MRLIDADELGASVIKNKVFDKGDVIKLIEDAPSIDIVRCGECKYAEVSVSPITGLWCIRFGTNDMAVEADDFCSYGEVSEKPTGSEKPNNCEHITEDGVTCAKYPACDDCLDNPLNKVKGSERLVKGSEQTDCQTCKWWSSCGYCVHRKCKGYAPQTERSEQ